MHPRASAIFVALAIGAAIAVGVPLGEIWLDCRSPSSEACVWDKALLPVSLAVGAALGTVVGAVAFFAMRAWQGRRRP